MKVVRKIRLDRRPAVEVAATYGVSVAYVYQVRSGRIRRARAIKAPSYPRAPRPNDLKLTKQQIEAIYRSPQSLAALALAYGVSGATIYRIKAGQLSRQRDAADPPVKINYPPRRGAKQWLTDEQILSIYHDERHVTVIAAEHGVTDGYVRGIKSQKSKRIRRLLAMRDDA